VWLIGLLAVAFMAQDKTGEEKQPAAQPAEKPEISSMSEPLSAPEKLQPSGLTEQLPAEAAPQPEVAVYLTEEKRIEKVPLEKYVRGVLAAEMPIEFELEAMKAQAIAARTYIVRRLLNHDQSGVPVKGAIVTDTVKHQVYLSEEKLSKKWSGEEAVENLRKLNRAVQETRDLVITYDGEPIEALFFSTSNGFTENSEDYWGGFVPYLRSVDSPWDKSLSPRYEETTVMDTEVFFRRLGLDPDIPVSSGRPRILEETEGHRVKSVRIGGKLFTGREVREKLGLNSTQFSWEFKKDKVYITTIGYGHGVGMSQWGANGMAMEGKTAEEILRHYYSGVQLEKASKIAIAS
jgi:stage II sporulation protein D